jgi:hypothetical protein
MGQSAEGLAGRTGGKKVKKASSKVKAPGSKGKAGRLKEKGER